MLIPQVFVMMLLLYLDKQGYAIVIGALMVGQLCLLIDFLKRPIQKHFSIVALVFHY